MCRLESLKSLGPVNTKQRIKDESAVNKEKKNRIEFVMMGKIRLKRLIFQKRCSMLLRDLYKTLSKIYGAFRLDLGGTMDLKLRL